MAAPKSQFTCQSCGAITVRWAGRCPTCSEWNTLIEEPVGVASAAVQKSFLSGAQPEPITAIDTKDEPRLTTGIDELDRVLGGGVVAGAVMLVGGDPGIGKSTLLLQACRHLCSHGKVLYISGEESPLQIRMRAERLKVIDDRLLVLAETRLEAILAQAETVAPAALVIDSIQTIHTDRVSSAPGSVSQIRESTAGLIRLAKSRGLPVFLVGHVTKDGAIAGPRVLEHMVDTVLYFEGDRGHAYRVLRAVKNRFGATHELGVFEMATDGLSQVANPSAFFLSERPTGASGSVVVAAVSGTRPILVEIQALVSPSAYGTARRTAIGLDGKRLNLLLAVLEKRAGIPIGPEDVYINVVGGMRLDDPAVDLGLALAVASSHLERPIADHTLVLGEVGLAGEVRAVQQMETRINEAARLGFKRFLVPQASAAKLRKKGVVGVANVAEAIREALP